MDYYKISGRANEFFKSYLKDRVQYVQVDTAKSKVKVAPPCSIIQGSKLSSLLYTIYTNEIP